jgi:hypothetical protein
MEPSMSRTPAYADPFQGFTWNLEPHICRLCGGRILSCVEEPAVARCADCSACGDTGVAAICACGAMDADAPLQIRCTFNAHPTPENPAEFVAIEAAPDRDVRRGGVPAQPRGDVLDAV